MDISIKLIEYSKKFLPKLNAYPYRVRDNAVQYYRPPSGVQAAKGLGFQGKTKKLFPLQG